MLTQELKTKLQTTQICKYLEPDELDTLISYSELLSFEKNTTIIVQGKVSAGLYIITEGTVLVTAKILGEGKATIAVLTSGNIIGEISLLQKSPATTSAISNSDVHCLLLTETYFDMLTLISPSTKYKMIRAITEQIYERIKNLHTKITKYMLESHMYTESIFNDVIRTLNRPEKITLSEAGIPKNYLANFPMLKLFNHNELEFLMEKSILIKAPKRCILIHESEKNLSCFFVLRGAVQSSIVANNMISKLAVFGPQEFFCNSAIIEMNKGSLINYTACECAILLKLSHDCLDSIQNDAPSLWYKLFDLICLSFVGLERSSDELDIRLNSELYNR